MFIEVFLQRVIDLRLSPEDAPDDEAHSNEADGQNFPPGPLVGAAHRTVHFPGSVAGFTAGELDGLGCFFIWRFSGLCITL